MKTLAIAAMLLASAAAQEPGRRFINPEGVSNPKGLGYTQVVTSPPGRMIFVSGQGGSVEGKLPEDFASQAKNTFENMGRCLKAAGASFSDIVKINYYVTDMNNTAELRRIRAQYLNQSAPPAATLVQVGLGRGMLLEVEAIAIAPK
jgi:enamine deaminase RidA (YjgF/YER057c/UK114 family)